MYNTIIKEIKKRGSQMKKGIILTVGMFIGLTGCGIFKGNPPEGDVTKDEILEEEHYIVEMQGLHGKDDKVQPLIWDAVFTEDSLEMSVNIDYFEDTLNDKVDIGEITADQMEYLVQDVSEQWHVQYNNYYIEDNQMILSDSTNEALSIRAPITFVREDWSIYWYMERVDRDTLKSTDGMNDLYFFENVDVQIKMTPESKY